MVYSAKLASFWKSLLSWMIILVMMVGMCPVDVSAVAGESYKSASIVFGNASDIGNNMSCYAHSNVNADERVEKGGRYGIERSPEDHRLYLCLFVADSYWYTDTASDIAVTVEYYDEGSGKFTLRYQSEKDGRWATPYNDEGWEIVEMTGANAWKSHTFYLEDCLLNNNLLFQADIEIGLWSSEMGTSADNIVFGSVKIEEIYPQNPVKTELQHDKTAYIYGEKDPNKINIALENRTNDVFTTTVSYAVTDYNGETVISGGYDTEIGALGTNTTTVNTGTEKYGVYDVTVTTSSVRKSDSKEYINTESKRIAKVLTTEDGDKKNNYLRVCTHLERYDQEIALEQAERSGFSGIRQEYYYSTALSEGAKVGAENGLALSAEMQERIELVKENNLEMLQILAYNSNLDEGVVIPETDEEIAGFAAYCGFMAKELLGVTNKFEIWNEPNHASFSGDGQTASDYVKLLKAAYNAIIAENPDAVVYAGAIASAESTSYLREMISAGAADYCHGISVHPYTWYPLEAFDHQERIKTINKFKNVLELYRVNKPVVFTEIGWTTSDCDSGVTEEEQAIYCVQLPTISIAHDLADEVYLYSLKATGVSKTSTNHNFGITEYYRGNNANAVKPSYVALAAYNKFMAGDVTYIESVEASDLSTAVHTFENEAGKKTAIFWTTDSQTTDLEVNLEHCKASVYDMYGNKLETLYSDDGIYTVLAEAEPKYLISDYDIYPSTFSTVSTTINYETREVTVKGEIANRNIGEEMTVIAIPKGISPDEKPEQIVYINQVEVNSNFFEHIFTVPSSSTAESFDIYLCGNYVDKMQTDSVEYLSLRVATLDFTGTETQLTAAAYASNHLGTDKDITIMIAQYENGMLKKVDAVKRTVSNNTNNVPVSLTVEKANGATSYKAFVMDSVDNIKPLCGAKEI